MQQFIYIDETLDCLQCGDGLKALSTELKSEISGFCDQIDADISYVLADVILDRRTKRTWEIRVNMLMKNILDFYCHCKTMRNN